MLKFIGEQKFQKTLAFEKFGVFHKTDNWNSLNMANVTDFFLSEAQESGPSIYIYINDLDNSENPRSFFTNFLLPSIITDIAIKWSIPFLFFSISEQKVNPKARLSKQAFLNPKNSAETSSALLNQYAQHQSPKFFKTYFSHLICSTKSLGLLLAADNLENSFLQLSVKTKTSNAHNVGRKTLTSVLLDNNFNFLLSEYGSILLLEKNRSS